MADPKHVDILNQGAKSWNEWREKNSTTTPDLRDASLIGRRLAGVELSNAELSNTDLSGSDLIGAHLNDANLSSAKLSWADLRGAKAFRANLRRTDLRWADLTCVNLCDADLRWADLRGANLSWATLIGANFGEAMLFQTVLGSVDLRGAQGLDSCQHFGPSIIDHQTFQRSGRLSLPFLLGCGLPRTLINYLHSPLNPPIQFYSCFISHSSKDKGFCRRLYADIQAKGVGAWYFPEDATWGKSAWGEISQSIERCDRLIVVCSKNSLQSGPVQREIDRALNREDEEQKNILFPIRIDDYLFKGWKHARRDDLLAKVVGDFRGWRSNPAKYSAALGKLIAALKKSRRPRVIAQEFRRTPKARNSGRQNKVTSEP